MHAYICMHIVNIGDHGGRGARAHPPHGCALRAGQGRSAVPRPRVRVGRAQAPHLLRHHGIARTPKTTHTHTHSSPPPPWCRAHTLNHARTHTHAHTHTHTQDAQKFHEYFDGAPIFTIPGRRCVCVCVCVCVLYTYACIYR